MRLLVAFVVVALVAAGAIAGKWPLRAPHAPMIPSTFDCAMRKFAYEYGQNLLPAYGQFSSLFYALGLNADCGVETPDFTPRDGGFPVPTFPSATPENAACTYFVDYNGGSDSNSGSISNPFKTIARAVAVTAGKGSGCTVNLRAGTHYLAETVQFSALNSGLTIQNYNGEVAIVSGGRIVDVNWKPYNVTPGPSPSPPSPPTPSQWITEDNMNYVYGMPVGQSPYPIIGKYASKELCEAACQNFTGCLAYTWHDQNQQGYELDCIGRTDGHYVQTSQSGHYSGRSPAATPLGPSPSPPIAKNMYVADVSGQGFADMPGLQMDGVRVTRARYPNGNVETTIPDNRITGTDVAWQSPDLSKQGKQQYITVTDPSLMRNSSDSFQQYMVGVGGPCDVYDPPVSYWCSQNPSGGGAFAFRVPRGFWTEDESTLPNMPYKDPSRAIVNVWRPARWEVWMFEVAGYDPATRNITFGRGGFQGARGDDSGGDFYIENIFEEFDYPNEFFYDNTNEKLYFFYNGTGSPPTSSVFVVPETKVLFNLTASQFSPITDVTIQGLTFTQTAFTYMDPHGVPSGGDWALDRTASVFLQGTVGTTIDKCNFTRLDGNGVMISGFNRNTTVSNSEFSWIGGNAMLSWGFTNETSLQGIFGTDGNHPENNYILNNVAREIGHYEKQSSFYMQAKTALSTISGNVFFNGPRAGINFNDGFGGGDVLSNNLIFSTCRESGDHGPFNSWDRQVFVTDVRTGKPDVQMAWREIHHNFLIDNYSPQEDVDNDDGSCYYKTHDNFLVYGGQGMKNDFGGHDNYHYNNIYAYTGECLGVCSQIDGHEDAFYNNTAVITGTDVGSFTCSGPGATIIHDNHLYTPDGTASECGHSPPTSPGTTVSTWPTDDELISWARAKIMPGN